jgi:FlaA1/EpsC-like NDP-sugar epimerase
VSSHLFALPRGALLVDYMLCLAGLCTARLGSRLYRERLSLAQISEENMQRIAIVGAGDAGASLASEFLNSPRRGFRPVLFFDDDKGKHGKLIHGVRVMGTPERIADLKDKNVVTKIVIAMPSASARRISEVVRLAQEAGLKVETLPTLAELASGRATASRIRPVEVQDLLGREAVNLDSDRIRNLIEGRVVMVTGAGGSIGSELCRQIAKLNPKRLLMVEQAEGNLFTIEQELIELGLGGVALPIVGDILDRDRMESVFARHRPEVIFHAAAHKHVYMMERQPAEAIRNNVFGTRCLALLAAAHGTRSFVMISTDKAINPTSVMGATKRLAEIQVMAIYEARKQEGTKFMAVRFGNVLGSSGSVIPIFKRQIANGGPVTVTHPDVMRYFMTIPEAVGLVLQSTVMGNGGEIFVLDMGQPVKIVDLARQMIELSGFKPEEDIEIKFTGMKPGEKLCEELRQLSEEYRPTDHPHIMRFVGKTELDEAGLQKLELGLHSLEPAEVKKALQGLVPGYTPYLD